eukprot:Clim_evm14s205 gene=Clim_evmTU14s205
MVGENTDVKPAPAADTLTFKSMFISKHSGLNLGVLKMNASGLAFKEKEAGTVHTLHAQDLKKAIYGLGIKGMELRLINKDNSNLRFQGFAKDDYSTLSKFFRDNYQQDLRKEQHAVKGHNWGKIETRDRNVVFNIDGHPSMALPMGEIANSHAKNAEEVMIEFHPDDGRHLALTEIYFHLPQKGEDIGDEDERGMTAEDLDAVLQERANIQEVVGELVTTFDNVQSIVPRGRFEIGVHPTFASVKSKSYDYKIVFENLQRMFVLPNPDMVHMFYMLHVDPPVRQGQTRYPYVILQFDQDEQSELQLTLSEDAKKRLEENGQSLETSMSGQTYQLFANIMKALTRKKITIPKDFRAADGESRAVRCSMKANEGLLFPLERYLIFVKPAIVMRYDEISMVTFNRVDSTGAGRSRYFDLDVNVASGQVHSFTSIPHEELDALQTFLTNKNLQVKIVEAQKAVPTMKDQEHDAYMAQLDAEDDDEEEDEDFAAGGGSDESSEEEDSDESDSDDYSSDSDSMADDLGDPTSKKKKAKAAEASKKPKKEKSEGGAKRKREPKDPNAPKKPASAYILFGQDEREQVKKDKPDIENKEIMVELGKRWNAADAATKKKYEDKAEQAKVRYQEELKAYEAKKAKTE